MKRAALNDLLNDSLQQTPYRRPGELVPVLAYRQDKQEGSEHSSACPRQKIEVTLLQYWKDATSHFRFSLPLEIVNE